MGRGVGVADGTAVGFAVGRVFGVGCADGWTAGVADVGAGTVEGEEPPLPAAGVGLDVATTVATCLRPWPGTPISGAPALGRRRPTPGMESGSSDGELTRLSANRAM